MSSREAIGLVGVLLGLGCGGVEALLNPALEPLEPGVEEPGAEAPGVEEPKQPEPKQPEPEDWIEIAVEEALGWEEMPGTTMDEDYAEQRRGELRTFFEAHEVYADPQEREKLADLACAFQIEGAHERLRSPKPREAAEVEVDGDGWRLVVAHASGWCTSDDWSWFTAEVGEALEGTGIVYAYAGAENDVLVVRRGGAEVARHPLEGQGYLLLAEGRPPGEAPHDMVDGVLEAASGYFGIELER